MNLNQLIIICQDGGDTGLCRDELQQITPKTDLLRTNFVTDAKAKAADVNWR